MVCSPVLGWLIAVKHAAGLRSKSALVAQGLLILFAVNYIVGAQFDIYMWRTYFPTTPFYHEVGPHWPTRLFMRGLNGMKISGPLFLLSFFVTLGIRGRIENRVADTNMPEGRR